MSSSLAVWHNVEPFQISGSRYADALSSAIQRPINQRSESVWARQLLLGEMDPGPLGASLGSLQHSCSVCLEKNLFALGPCAKHSPHTSHDWVTHTGVCDTRLYITSQRVWGSVMQFACHGDPVASPLSPTTGVSAFFFLPLQTQYPYFSGECWTADRMIMRLLVTPFHAS